MSETFTTVQMGTRLAWHGGEGQMFNLAKGLRERGHRVVIVAPPKSEMVKRFGSEGFEVRELAVRTDFDLLAALKLKKILKKIKPDIYHCHDARSVLVGTLAARVARVKKNVVSRRVDFRIKSRWKYRIWTDKIIAISEAVKRVLLACGLPEQFVAVVRSGINPHRFRLDRDFTRTRAREYLGAGRDIFAIGNVARLENHKGHVYLLEAMPAVLKEIPNAVLFLVGSGELDRSLRKKAAELGIENSVVFLGHREDVPKLLRAFDLFVMPSHLEGLCTSLMDAMQCEVPVIGTDAGGIPEIIAHGHNGIVVPKQNPAALGGAVIELFRDEGKRNRFTRAGVRTIHEHFTDRSMVDGTIEVYRELLAEHHG